MSSYWLKMDEGQKDRLEQELRFLKESLEADVISKDEYQKGVERIERKLKELEEPGEERSAIEEETQEQERLEKAEPEEDQEETEREESEYEEEKAEEEQPEIEIKEIKEKPTKIIGAEEEQEEIEKEEPADEKEPEKKIKSSEKWIYGIAILIIAVLLFFLIRGCKGTAVEETIEFIPECTSDSGCKQEGMVGICLSPGTKEAKCEFKQDAETKLTIISDKDCKLCDPSNMKNIIREIFPNVRIKELDYQTSEAKTLINQLGVDALPAYIFDSNVSNAINFDNFKTALIKKSNNYLISNTASGAIYYFKRPLMKNKFDLYITQETTGKIEKNVQEVLDLFNDKLNFTEHTVTESQKAILEKELAINTYPTFLFNNQIKFRGFLPSNTIKEKICEVSYFDECKAELSKI